MSTFILLSELKIGKKINIILFEWIYWCLKLAIYWLWRPDYDLSLFYLFTYNKYALLNTQLKRLRTSYYMFQYTKLYSTVPTSQTICIHCIHILKTVPFSLSTNFASNVYLSKNTMFDTGPVCLHVIIVKPITALWTFWRFQYLEHYY